MNARDRKLAELVLYVADRCATDRRFGATKLNKILFFSDFIHYGLHGDSITGAAYQRLDFGPAPRRLLPVRDELIDERHLAIDHSDYFGRPQKRPVALRDADLSDFSGREIDTVNKVIKMFETADATAISEASHRLAGWQIAENGDTIPYESVFVSERELSDAERAYAETLN